MSDSIFDEYPEAAPFADLFTTDDPDEVRELAADIARRVRAVKAKSTKAAADPAPSGDELAEAEKTVAAFVKDRGGRTKRAEPPTFGQFMQALWTKQAPARAAQKARAKTAPPPTQGRTEAVEAALGKRDLKGYLAARRAEAVAEAERLAKENDR